MENPDSLISGKTVLPASVISPSRSMRRHRSLFNSDQLLRGFRGQSFCAVTSSKIFLVVLSIQPKHKASTTASTYQKVSSSTGRPRLTSPSIPSPYHVSPEATRVTPTSIYYLKLWIYMIFCRLPALHDIIT